MTDASIVAWGAVAVAIIGSLSTAAVNVIIAVKASRKVVEVAVQAAQTGEALTAQMDAVTEGQQVIHKQTGEIKTLVNGNHQALLAETAALREEVKSLTAQLVESKEKEKTP